MNRSQLLLVGLPLALAAASDLRTRRIPNTIVIATALTGLAAQFLSGGAAAAGVALLVSLGVGAALLFPWRAHMLGGGDLKMIAATSLWFAPARIAVFLLAVAIAGGALALAALAAAALRRVPATSTAGHAPSQPVLRRTIPYGVAIAIGGVVTAWMGG